MDVEGAIGDEYPTFHERGKAFLAQLDARRLPELDSLLEFYGGETHEGPVETYIKALCNLPPGVTELIIHCGVHDPELRDATPSTPRRDGNRRIFTDPATVAEIKPLGIEIITCKQFRQAGRSQGPRPAGRARPALRGRPHGGSVGASDRIVLTCVVRPQVQRLWRNDAPRRLSRVRVCGDV